jgi:3-isopropylmalate dehydrogenase
MSLKFDIAVLPGDGIGPEVITPTMELLEAAANGFELNFDVLEAGATHYANTGVSFPKESLESARQADAILLGAMGMPHIRLPNGTEIAPQLELREIFNLYAGVRPIRTFPGPPLPLASPKAAQLDSVLVRESTEGLFAARGKANIEKDQVARDTMVISRTTCEHLFDFTFELARRRKAQGHPGKVTCIDKANVLTSMAFFRRIFDERAERYPDITAEYCYVDAAALRMVSRPWEFDVMVTENMFGDILSDIGAGLMGGMGMAPSADIGAEHAVFQPCHGSAPDIVGQGKANPIATYLSAAMMLDWLGEKNQTELCTASAARIRNAVEAALAGGQLVPYELGGNAGTKAIHSEVMHHISKN